MKQHRPATSLDAESDLGVEIDEPELQPLGNAEAALAITGGPPQGPPSPPQAPTAPPPPADGGALPFGDELSAAFGRPLSDIPVKTGDPLPGEVGAGATASSDGIRFASTSPSLLQAAEEVAHYQQHQLGSSEQKHLGHDTDAAEREAKSVAREVAAGRPAPQVTERATAALQRDASTQAPDPNADATRLRAAIRSGDSGTISSVLSQPAAHVRAVKAAFDASSARGLVEELREAYSVWSGFAWASSNDEQWEFFSMLLARAGIEVPNQARPQLSREGWAISTEPALDLAVPGTKMRLRITHPDILHDGSWHYDVQWFCVNDPASVASQGAPARVDGPSDPVWDAEWAYPGTHTVFARVVESSSSGTGEPVWLSRSQRVVSMDDRMASAQDVQTVPWEQQRASLEFQRLRLAGGGIQDQSAGAGPHIECSGANPAVPGVAPNLSSNTYTVRESTAANFRWFAVPDSSESMPTQSFYGHQATTWQGAYALSLGTGRSASLTIAQSGGYTIVCEELSELGAPTGTVARYRQSVLNGEQAEQLRQFEGELRNIDVAMGNMSAEGRQTARAIYVNQETGQQVALNIYLGRKAGGEGVILVDATPGVRRKEYEGSTADAAISTFAADNSYPRGRIDLSVTDPLPSTDPGVDMTLLVRSIATDGTSSWSEWASMTGWASLGLFVAGGIAMLIPGGQVVAPVLFVAGAAAGAASGGLSIYDELQNAQPSGLKIAIDVLGIASSILGGGAALQAARSGAGVALTGMGRFFVYGSISADIGGAVLLSAQGIDEIAAILGNPSMDQAAKTRAIVGILSTLALNGGLIALGVRDARAVQSRLSTSLGAELVAQLDDRTRFMLFRLDDAALTALQGSPPQRLSRIASLLDSGRQVHIEGGNIHVDGRRMALSELDNLAEDAFQQLRRGTQATGQSHPLPGSEEHYRWLREGQPGVVRTEAQLSNADVAAVLNRQMQNVSPGEIEAMIARFPADQQALARQMLARASGFGNIDALTHLADAVRPHNQAGSLLFTPGSGSMADNLLYMSTKGIFPGGPLQRTNSIVQGAVVVLDEVVLSMIARDPAFARSLVDQGCVLMHPRGLVGGINLFNGTNAQAIEGQLSSLVSRTGAPAGNLDAAIAQTLDADVIRQLNAVDPRLAQRLQVVDPAAAAGTTSDDIARQLNGSAGITEQQVADALARLPERYRALARELLVQQSSVSSMRTFAQQLRDHHNSIVSLAGGREMYFYIYRPDKSYGMLAQTHRGITGTPSSRYINGPAELAGANLPQNSVLVVFDDVAASGESLESAFRSTQGSFQGQVIVAPMLSSDVASQRMGQLASTNPNLRYAPQAMVPTLEGSTFFQSLPPADQQMLRELIGAQGFDNNALSMVFPYMAPDNNNAFFGELFAPYFITNNTASAAKNFTPYQPPPN